MTVRYSPRIARWVAERAAAPLEEDGSLVLEHPVADESWAVRHVLQYGPDAEVVAPAELRAVIAERMRAMTAM
jgi:predicted DNA-binding transcriptional regulator YafY